MNKTSIIKLKCFFCKRKKNEIKVIVQKLNLLTLNLNYQYIA